MPKLKTKGTEPADSVNKNEYVLSGNVSVSASTSESSLPPTSDTLLIGKNWHYDVSKNEKCPFSTQLYHPPLVDTPISLIGAPLNTDSGCSSIAVVKLSSSQSWSEIAMAMTIISSSLSGRKWFRRLFRSAVLGVVCSPQYSVLSTQYSVLRTSVQRVRWVL